MSNAKKEWILVRVGVFICFLLSIIVHYLIAIWSPIKEKMTRCLCIINRYVAEILLWWFSLGQINTGLDHTVYLQNMKSKD